MALWILSEDTRRNIHSLTPIMVINHPLCASSIYYDPCLTVFFHNLFPTFLWSTSWPSTLHFILHIFLHPITVFFLQHMPIPSQPVLVALQREDMRMVTLQEFQVKGWESRIRWHNLGTTAKQVAIVWACTAKRTQWLGEEMYGVWSWECHAKR